MSTAQSRIITRSGVHQEVNMISIAAVNADTINSAIHEVSSILRARHGITSTSEDDFSIFSQESFTEIATQVTGILTIFLGGIAGISLLVGGIGIMNIMLVSVVERTKEIGLRKAVGARDSDILFQFLVESLIIGLVGGLLGILFGWGISSVIGQVAALSNAGFSTDISFSAVILSLVFSISVGLVFGVYPANRAAKLEPVEALRSE
jgi:putative ABC transport system permease protein